MQHAITALEAELAVLQDARRMLVVSPPDDVVGAERQFLLAANWREIRETEAGLAHLHAVAFRLGRAA